MKAQVAAEFIIVFSLALLIFVTLQVFYWQQRFNVEQEAASAEAHQIADRLATLIQSVSYQGGYNVSYDVPAALVTGDLFTLRVKNTSVDITWNNHTAVSSYPNVRVVNASGQENFMLTSGSYRIISSENQVSISAV